MRSGMPTVSQASLRAATRATRASSSAVDVEATAAGGASDAGIGEGTGRGIDPMGSGNAGEGMGGVYSTRWPRRPQRMPSGPPDDHHTTNALPLMLPSGTGPQ